MSKLDNALQAVPKGMSRLRAGGGGMGYRAATTQVEQPRSSLLDSLGRFAQAGADMFKAKEQRARDLADERSNEIIRKLTPEQRRAALNSGTLLYQDDPYAMEALRVKTGRNAAYLVDDDVMQKVKEGVFRTREEMEQYRHARLQEGAKSYAEQFGIDPEDADYQRGFNGDITERNISLYGAHDNFLSAQAQKGAIVNSRVELNGVLQDPSMLRRPDSAEFFEKYISNGLVTGAIPSDAQATQLIGQAFSDASSRAGGADFLLRVADKKVTLNGVTSTYRELMGEEQWNALMVTAQRSQFDNDAKLNEAFQLKVNSALNQDDPRVAWEQLQGIKAELDKVQPDEQMTPQREQLIAAETRLQGEMQRWTQEQAKALDKQKKTLNKNAVIGRQFDKRLAGEYLSTSYKDMPSNENTGDFEYSDMVNFADQKLREIDSMDIPDARKDRLKLDYLRSDSEDGPFRNKMKVLVSDAANEWQAALLQGKLPDKTPALDNLRRIRNADPYLFASLYPDKAGLFLKMDAMDRYGLEPSVLLDAERQRANRSQDQRKIDDETFNAALNSTEYPELARMPASLRASARDVYDAGIYLSGNESFAKEQMQRFMHEMTTPIERSDVADKSVGVLPRNMLQVSDDPSSWEQGKDLMMEIYDGILQTNPWLDGNQLSVYADKDIIRFVDTTGNINRSIDRDLLRRMYADKIQRLQAKATEEAYEAMNKRAPIAKVNKARKDTSEGKTKGVKGFGLEGLRRKSERVKAERAKKQ
ncbi:internal virion protein [Escherichia phage vB_Ec_Tarrare]|uniref:Internal virion protein n=1 Tax=Escherichia phage vB_Ec_Tarrare TaxID=3032379 RepID=A0AAF0D4F5_9CAUD|nr:internal virion protein [Escherichia phage vB_Ec_Tarrare]